MKSFHLSAIVVALLFSFLGRAADQPNAQAPRPEKPSASKPVTNVGVDEFARLVAAKTNLVLDVRTASEFTAGHIPGAVNLDVNSPDFDKKVAGLNKDKTYLVHCAAGKRSANACAKMEKLNFTHLVNLEPGFKAWEKAGKPVEK